VEREKLWEYVISAWKEGRFRRISGDELLRAYQVFDRECNSGEVLGFIPVEQFKDILRSSMTGEQIESFMSVRLRRLSQSPGGFVCEVAADENEEGKDVVYYEDYVDEMCDGVF